MANHRENNRQLKQYEVSPDQYSLSVRQLFVQSGIQVLVILLIAGALLVVLGLIVGYPVSEMATLLPVFGAAALVCSYLKPAVSWFKLKEQEAVLEKHYRDRDDFEKKRTEREWYVNIQGGGFLVYHRDYIQKLLSVKREKDEQSTVFRVSFVNCRGKNRSFYLYTPFKKEADLFRAWVRSDATAERKQHENSFVK